VLLANPFFNSCTSLTFFQVESAHPSSSSPCAGCQVWEKGLVHADSQEKRQQRQIEQDNEIVEVQGHFIEKLGATLGAVVTIKVDHRVVSHT
jgi:hypothetical protein